MQGEGKVSGEGGNFGWLVGFELPLSGNAPTALSAPPRTPPGPQ